MAPGESDIPDRPAGTGVLVLVAAVRNTLLEALLELSLAGYRSASGHVPFEQGLTGTKQQPIKGGLMAWHVYQRALVLLQACRGISRYWSNEKEALRRSPGGHTPPVEHGSVVQHPRNSTSLS
jgi:hypothetical protein